MTKWYILTLDSHEWFGPFESHAAALAWRRHASLRSFRITIKLPIYANARKP